MTQNRKKAKSLMILGTGSHVGKSVLVTALCRIFADAGYKTAPFKSQNMSLNSWITKDGGEIGIAQAVQAKAAGVEPVVEMNPVLLKPKGDCESQVIILGKPFADRAAGRYYDSIDIYSVMGQAYEKLDSEYDVIVIEGAGGAAEINLYERDIVNIGTARLVKPPIILVGDIERGGVFASIYGTIMLLPADVRSMIKGIIINKFRGDMSILKPGLDKIEQMTGVPVLGVIPYFDINIPSEDSVSLKDKIIKKKIKQNGRIRDETIEIGILKLPRISNFTDFEPLEPHAKIRYIEMGEYIGKPDALIIPGTKNTVEDLKELRLHGMDRQVKAFAGKIPLIGICGGYQMLGKKIIDNGIEGSCGNIEVEGLGILDVTTRFDRYAKHTRQVQKKVTGNGAILGQIKGEYVSGYEIHMGETTMSETNMCEAVNGRWHAFEDDGCTDRNGLVIGTYLHGIFENENMRNAFLGYLYKQKGIPFNGSNNSDGFSDLANIVRSSIDIEKVCQIAGVS